jgi:hypothetical protein
VSYRKEPHRPDSLGVGDLFLEVSDGGRSEHFAAFPGGISNMQNDVSVILRDAKEKSLSDCLRWNWVRLGLQRARG